MRWEQVSIGDLFLKKSSNRKQKDLVSEGYPVFGASGLSGFAHDFDVQVPYFGVVKDGAGVGRVSVHPAESSVVGTMECLIPKPGLHFEFLGYCLRRIRFERYVTGSTIPHVYFKDYKNEMVALPPLEEQKRIAGILDEADRVRKKTQVLIDKYDELAQSLFLDMFGDPVTNPKGWAESSLSDLSRNLITYGIVQAGPEVESGVPFIKTGDIKNGEIMVGQLRKTSNEIAGKYERSKCAAGDIVMSIRATVGTTAVVPPELDGVNLTQGTARISPNPDVVEQAFLLHALRSNGFQTKIEGETKGATFREITLGRLRALSLMRPPKEIQLQFGERIKSIEGAKTTSKNALKKAERCFNALIQKAFKGELT